MSSCFDTSFRSGSLSSYLISLQMTFQTFLSKSGILFALHASLVFNLFSLFLNLNENKGNEDKCKTKLRDMISSKKEEDTNQ
jgi:hypothetical protein